MLLVMTSLIVLNLPVIFGSEIWRPLMIDLTAIIGAVVTTSYIFLKYVLELPGATGMQADFFAFTVGAFLWLCAEASWAYYREGLGVEVPYPSFADLFWLLGYGFFLFHNYSVIAKLRGILTIDRSMICACPPLV